MAASVFTGWRTLTPGECSDCGFGDGWQCGGDGSVWCECEECIECGEQPGWHTSACELGNSEGEV